MTNKMKDSDSIDSLENPELNRLELFLYLTPVVGFFPALWRLYRRGSREQLAVSRLAVTLAFSWLLVYISLGAGADSAESFRLPLLLVNSLFTSGYFVVSVWLMIRLGQRQPLRLPILSHLADRVVRKYLS